MKIRTILYCYVVALVSVMLLFNLYSIFVNETNHTGFNLDYLTIWCVITFVVSLGFCLIKKNLSDIAKKIIVILAIISLVSTLNIVLFKHFNIMMSYQEWLKKGMPEKPF